MAEKTACKVIRVLMWVLTGEEGLIDNLISRFWCFPFEELVLHALPCLHFVLGFQQVPLSFTAGFSDAPFLSICLFFLLKICLYALKLIYFLYLLGFLSLSWFKQ